MRIDILGATLSVLIKEVSFISEVVLYTSLLHSLKLKTFAGQRTATKNFSVKFQVPITDARRGMGGKFYPQKFVFEQNLAKP